ncbi:LysE family translocator [Erwinia sp. JUb26]|uniref:LysE family translocator n=1 Tax=Erwinia sp. JUb26 TaxID=2485126 RepID=UPI000F4886B7|nr:LysE family translocator [Erwinia sp. JUb26]ROR14598.1 threonine/homoserine/homoserine lactone efflux protein [Erwinia sp. JUb26]
MSLHLFISFWAVSALFIITPGADWAYAISAGLRGRAIIPAIAGLLSGHLIATIIVAAGVGALIAATHSAMTILTLAGAAYLLWLGVGMLRHPSAPTAATDEVDDSRWQWALRGLCVSGLNPKVFLLFLALLPQFIDPLGSWPVPIQMTALGLLHIVSCSVVYLLVGYGSKAVLQTRPEAALLVSRISGFLMIVIAIVLMAERFF